MKPSKAIISEVLASKLSDIKGATLKLEDYLFPEQLAFVRDPEPFRTACNSRRSGKSVSCAADLLDTALRFPDTVGLYITLSRANAKRILWPIIKKINVDHKLGGIPSESDLSLTFPNNSIIYLSGAMNANEIERFRGLPLKKCYLDECQSFRAHIKDLVDDVIAPALMDWGGSLILIGTPGCVPSGYFYECCQNPSFKHYFWTFFQNPHIAQKSGMTHQAILDRELKRRGVTVEDPSVQREWFGKWVLDSNSLVFKYNYLINHYDALPVLTDYVIALDVGLLDADSVVVIGWHRNLKDCFLVTEYTHSGQDITTLANQIDALYKKYNPLKIVMDTGGLGAKIAEELRKRFGLPITAAEKTRKSEFIALLNDALRNGRFKAKRTSRFATDCMIVEWDLDKSTSDKMVMKDEPHSDVCDAVLYGYRESLHWLSEPEKPKVDLKKQWVEYSRQLHEDQLERQIQQQQADEQQADIFAQMDSDPFNEDPLRFYLNKKRNR